MSGLDKSCFLEYNRIKYLKAYPTKNPLLEGFFLLSLGGLGLQGEVLIEGEEEGKGEEQVLPELQFEQGIAADQKNEKQRHQSERIFLGLTQGVINFQKLSQAGNGRHVQQNQKNEFEKEGALQKELWQKSVENDEQSKRHQKQGEQVMQKFISNQPNMFIDFEVQHSFALIVV